MNQQYEYIPLYYPEPTPVTFIAYDEFGLAFYEFGVAFHDFVWSNWKKLLIEDIVCRAKEFGYSPDEAIIELDV